jgi:hypothetical protein
MNKIFFIIFLIFLSANFLSAQENKLGEIITLTEKTDISSILENPEEFLGKKVLVEGEIVEVCQAAGCWMDIKSQDPNEKIRIKVKDGVIVFPVESIGSKAIIEGEVYKIELDEEEAKIYFEHMAEDAGIEFDESTVTGPVTLYQIKGIGAEIF